MNLNKAIQNTPYSEVSEYFGKVPKDAVNFSLGEPLFQPPDSVKEAYMKAAKEGHSRYSSVQGMSELRHAVADKLETGNRISSKPDEILITSGANEGIAISMLSLVDKGEEVIICEPSYPAFRPLVRYCGGIPKPLFLKEENNFQPDLEELKNLMSRKTTWNHQWVSKQLRKPLIFLSISWISGMVQ